MNYNSMIKEKKTVMNHEGAKAIEDGEDALALINKIEI